MHGPKKYQDGVQWHREHRSKKTRVQGYRNKRDRRLVREESLKKRDRKRLQRFKNGDLSIFGGRL